MNIKVKLSTLWIIVLFNILFADVLSIFVELVDGNSLNIIGEVKTTMAFAALLLNIPLMMIYFSRSLNLKLNRVLNIIAGFITILFVIAGGSLIPHYFICAGIEVMALIVIIVTAWKWNEIEN